MELAKRQAALARLATDAELRTRFLDSPCSAAATLRLAPDEAGRLAANLEGLPQFARALLGKRLGEVRRLLPLTATLLGDRFDEEFRRFADAHPSQGPHRHERDALELARLLLPTLVAESRETLQLETGWIEARLGRRVVARRLGPARLALWLRTGRRVRHWRLGFGGHSTTAPSPARESK